MAMAALATLDRDPHGFFVMIEGGRIDHGGHANSLVDAVQETLAFDDTVAQVAAWARARGNVTLLVTADHECGGLEVVGPAPAGTYPTVRWRWGNHTNARVAVFGEGPGASAVDGAVIDQRWIYAIARARVDRGGADRRRPASRSPTASWATSATASRLQRNPPASAPASTSSTRCGSTRPPTASTSARGPVRVGRNAVEVWIDVDPGAAPACRGPAGAVTDAIGVADRRAGVVAGQRAGGRRSDADLAWSRSAAPIRTSRTSRRRGLRGLHPPYGQPGNLGWLRAAINFGAVRTHDAADGAGAGPGHGGVLAVVGAVSRAAWCRGRAAAARGGAGQHHRRVHLQPVPAAAAAGQPQPGRRRSRRCPASIEYQLDANRDGLVDGDEPPDRAALITAD
jgi:hypothetical protein